MLPGKNRRLPSHGTSARKEMRHPTQGPHRRDDTCAPWPVSMKRRAADPKDKHTSTSFFLFSLKHFNLARGIRCAQALSSYIYLSQNYL